jgi:hemolysin activation/secretion protein
MMLVDGFIEEVDLGNVPARLVRPLRRLLGPLVGQRNLMMASLERRLTLADDMAGATIRSALGPGRTLGGTRLIIQASHRPLSGSITFDNRQSPAFRGRNTTLQLSLASPFGLGEQIYGYVSADPWHGIGSVFGRTAPRRTYGSGIIVPLDGNGTTLNTEYTRSITQPLGGFFDSRDTFERASLRLSHPLIRTRRITLSAGPMFDFERERNFLPAFGVALSRDRYLVMRMNANLGVNAGAGFYAGSATISYGSSGSRGPDDFPSRAGAIGHFVKIEARASVTSRLPQGFVLATTASAQALLRGGVPAAELFSIDGGDGISGVLSGTLASDEGYVARSELRRAFRHGALLVQPHAYAAVGDLHARVPTPFDIASGYGYGAGATLGYTVPGTAIAPFATVEYGRARAFGAAAYRFDDRIFVTAGVRF